MKKLALLIGSIITLSSLTSCQKKYLNPEIPKEDFAFRKSPKDTGDKTLRKIVIPNIITKK